jgi:hypothetical protein
MFTLSDQHHALVAILLGITWYSLYRRLLGLQGDLDRCGGILCPTGFVPWSVQSVASCCTDYTIVVPSHESLVVLKSHNIIFT